QHGYLLRFFGFYGSCLGLGSTGPSARRVEGLVHRAAPVPRALLLGEEVGLDELARRRIAAVEALGVEAHAALLALLQGGHGHAVAEHVGAGLDGLGERPPGSRGARRLPAPALGLVAGGAR